VVPFDIPVPLILLLQTSIRVPELEKCALANDFRGLHSLPELGNVAAGEILYLRVTRKPSARRREVKVFDSQSRMAHVPADP
jgi:hypothetical protein